MRRGALRCLGERAREREKERACAQEGPEIDNGYLCARACSCVK
jgi:hypothetical protein